LQNGLPCLQLLVKLVPSKMKSVPGVEGQREGANGEGLVAGDDKPKDQGRRTQAPEYASPQDQATGPSDSSVISQDHPEAAQAMPESDSQSESEDLTKRLLGAYQATLDLAEELPAVVWVAWTTNGLGRYLKVPLHCGGDIELRMFEGQFRSVPSLHVYFLPSD
jgi:hypothetical protein